jgi:hypothetical protein
MATSTIASTTATITSLAQVPASVLVDPDNLCNLQICLLPLGLAHFTHLPSLPGNVLYTAIFGLVFLIQVFFGIRYRIWGFLVGMIGGLVLEIIGYIGRIEMHSNPFQKAQYLQYLITLTIGPTFISASIYLCLARIVVVYGEHLSRVTPRFFAVVFIALLPQAAGAMASTANTPSQDRTGKNIMVAGVAWQVFSLALFASLCCEFAWRIHKSTDAALNTNFYSIRNTFKFRGFLWSIAIATFCIFIRPTFRCAELSGGFKGPLANQQITFMILEGAMIVTAVSIDGFPSRFGVPATVARGWVEPHEEER